MRKTIFVEIISFVVLLSIFSLVLIKYYDPEDKTKLKQAIPKPIIVHGYNINQVIDKEKISAEFSTIQSLTQEGNSQISTNSVPVLIYHGITPQSDGLDVTVEQFTEQMMALKKAGYQTVRLDDFYAFLRGEKQLPAKSFLLTFDDGRKDSYYFTDYVLQTVNYSAVMFVVTRYSVAETHSYYLNLKELKTMHKSGRWEIQSHSHQGHARIPIAADGTKSSFFGNKAWLSDQNRLETEEEYRFRIREDIQKAKTLLEQEFNHTIHSFAIPFGDYGQYITNFAGANKANEEIYRSFHNMIFYQYKPIKNRDFRANYNDRKEEDFYFVIRMTVDSSSSTDKLIEMLEASQEITLPYTEEFDNEFRWVQDWGTFKSESDHLTLINSGNFSTTTLAYLDGSYLWRDYEYNVKIDRLENSTFAILTRFQNVDTYAGCIYNHRYVVFETVHNGTKIESIRTRLPVEVTLHNRSNFGMTVDGNHVICTLNDIIVYDGQSSSLPAYGGVALKSGTFEQAISGIVEIKELTIQEVHS